MPAIMNRTRQSNNIIPRKLRVAIAAIALVAVASVANATTTSSSFQVAASVNAQCSVTANDLAFGAVDPLGANVDQTTTLSVKCTKNSPYTVGLNAGAVSGSAIADRLMANGADVMHYQLYS